MSIALLHASIITNVNKNLHILSYRHAGKYTSAANEGETGVPRATIRPVELPDGLDIVLA